MSFILKKERLFRERNKESENLVHVVRKRSEFRMKNYTSATDNRAWCMDDEERRRYQLELIEGSPPWETAITGFSGQFVPLPTLIDLLVKDKLNEIQDLHLKLTEMNRILDHVSQYLTSAQQQELQKMRKHLEQTKLETGDERAREYIAEDTRSPVADSRKPPILPLSHELNVENGDIQSALQKKEAEMTSLIQSLNECCEKEEYLMAAFQKLDIIHDILSGKEKETEVQKEDINLDIKNLKTLLNKYKNMETKIRTLKGTAKDTTQDADSDIVIGAEQEEVTDKQLESDEGDKHRVVFLEQELEASKRQSIQLQNELEMHTSAMKDREDRMSELEQELEAQKRDRDVLQRKLHYSRNQMSSDVQMLQLQTSLEECDRERELLQQRSITMKAELEALRRERDELRQRSYNDRDIQSRCSSLEQMLENQSVSIQNLSAERDTLRMRLEDYVGVEAELERLRFRAQEVEVFRIERDRLKVKVEELSGFEKAYRELLDKVHRTEMEQAETDESKLKSEEPTILETELQEMKEQFEKMRSCVQERETLADKVRMLEESIAKQEEEIKKLVAQIDALSLEREYSQAKVLSTMTELHEEIEKNNIQVCECAAQLAEMPVFEKQILGLKQELDVAIGTAAESKEESEERLKQLLSSEEMLKENLEEAHGQLSEKLKEIKHLEDEVCRLTQVIQQSDENNRMLENNVVNLERELELLKHATTSTEQQEQTGVTEENKKLIIQIEELKREIASLQENICECEEMREIKQQLATLTKQNLQLKDENTELKESISKMEYVEQPDETDALKALVLGSNAEISELKGQIFRLSQAATGVAAYQAQVTEMQKEYESLQGNLKRESEARSVLEQQLTGAADKLREALEEKRASIEHEKNIMNSSQEKAKNYENKIANERAQREQLQKTIECNEDALEKQKIVISELQEKITMLNIELENEKENVMLAQHVLTKSEIEHVNKDEEKEKITKEKCSLEEQVRKLKSENEHLKEEVEKLKTENINCQEIEEENERLKREITALKEELDQDKTRTEEQGFSALRQRYEELDSENSELRNRLKDCEEHLHTRRSRIQEYVQLKDREEDMKEKAESETAEEMLIAEFEHLKVVYEQLINENHKLQESRKTCEDELADIEKQKADIEKQKAAIEAEFYSMQDKYNEKCHEVNNLQEVRQTQEPKLQEILPSDETMEDIKATYEQEKEQRESTIKELLEKLELTSAENRELKERISTLTQSQEQRTISDSWDPTPEELAKHLKDAEDTVRLQYEEIQKLKEKLSPEQAQDQKEQLENVNKELQEKLAQVVAENRELKEKISALNQQTTEPRAVVGSWTPTPEELAKYLKDAEDTVRLQYEEMQKMRQQEWDKQCQMLQSAKTQAELDKEKYEKEKMQELEARKKLEKVVEELKIKFAEKEERKTENSEETIRLLTEKVQTLTKELNIRTEQLEGTLCSCTTEKQELEESLRVLREELRMCKEMSRSVAKIEDDLVKKKSAELTNERLLEELEAAKAEKCQLEQSLKVLQEELKETSKSVVLLNGSLEQEKKTHLTNQNLLDELETARAEIAALQNDKKEIEKKYLDCQEQLKRQDRDETVLTPQKETTSDVAKLKGDLEDQKKTGEILFELETARAEIAALKNDKKEMEKKYLECQEQLKRQDGGETMRTLEQELEQLKRRYEQCQEKLEAQDQKEADAATAQAGQQENEIDQLKKMLKECEEEKNKIRLDNEQKLKHLEEEVETLRENKEQLLQSLKEVETKHKNVENELQQKVKELEVASTGTDLESLRLKYEQEMSAKENQYNENIKRLKGSYERDMTNLSKRHDTNILKLQKQHEEELQDTARLHQSELRATREQSMAEDHSQLSFSKMQVYAYGPEPEEPITEDKEDTVPEDTKTEQVSNLPSENFAAILKKILVEGLNSLTFAELSLMHQQICQVTSDLMLEDQNVTCSDKKELAQRITALQLKIVNRQGRAKRKAMDLELCLHQELKRVSKLRHTLLQTQNCKSSLQRQILNEAKSISDLQAKRALLTSQITSNEQQIQHYATLVEQEKVKTRVLMDELMKEHRLKRDVENLLRTERERSRNKNKRHSAFVEEMNVRIAAAVRKEADLHSTINHKITVSTCSKDPQAIAPDPEKASVPQLESTVNR